jgi:hypothetical protein
MIGQEGAPCLRRRLARRAWHQTRDLALRDLDAELEQLAMDARGAHSGLASATWRARPRVRRSKGGRPRGLRERRVQKRRKAERCQGPTVAGLTSTRTSRQRHHARDSATQKIRSVQAREGRGRLRRRTTNCLRRARFSRASALRVRSADLATASRVSRSESTAAIYQFGRRRAHRGNAKDLDWIEFWRRTAMA